MTAIAGSVHRKAFPVGCPDSSDGCRRYGGFAAFLVVAVWWWAVVVGRQLIEAVSNF